VGTVLLSNIFKAICAANNLTFKILYGKQDAIPSDADVILYAHSLIDLTRITTPFIGVHMIRDPRDIIVSGYLYHKRTTEDWCINTHWQLVAPIVFPQVPYSQEHRPDSWKANYFNELNGLSYQENLNRLNQDDGLLFEMLHYGAWTIDAMANWNYTLPSMYELKMETIDEAYDKTFENIFMHLGFTDFQISEALAIAKNHDLNRKTSNEIAQMQHVSSPNLKKWKTYFNDSHKSIFRERFGDVLQTLNYETSNYW
jgi:hypothetical protein